MVASASFWDPDYHIDELASRRAPVEVRRNTFSLPLHDFLPYLLSVDRRLSKVQETGALSRRHRLSYGLILLSCASHVCGSTEIEICLSHSCERSISSTRSASATVIHVNQTRSKHVQPWIWKIRMATLKVQSLVVKMAIPLKHKLNPKNQTFALEKAIRI